ncbi:unnamed protein product [Cunninghamella blakesleeana]
MVHAQFATIDAIMKGSSDDIMRLIIFLQHRIELEEGYQNSLVQILIKLEENETANPLYQSAVNTHSKKIINEYISLDNSFKPFRGQYLQLLKSQLQSLIKLKEQQDKSRRLQRKNMQVINNMYITTRTEELPKARDEYFSKWEEIDRVQNVTPSNYSITTPTTPTTARSATLKPLSPEEFSDIVSLSPANTVVSDDNMPTTPTTNQISNQNKVELSSAPTQKKFQQFMKQFHMNHHSVDPSKQGVRLAKLKVEMNEADNEYRRVVRKLDNLTRKQQKANEGAIRVLQEQLYEKSQCIKHTLIQLASSEYSFYHLKNEVIGTLKNSLKLFNPELDKTIFDKLLSRDKYPMPSPVYYINHHSGECKDLIFGMGLIEYSQTKFRSPPLVVIKCIEAVEGLNGLQKEGIYRISGKSTSIEKIKQAFERDEEGLVFGENDVPDEVYCIASVLKIFLRELATPLFPFVLADRITYSQIPDKELRLMNLLTRIIKLPGPNYDTLKILVEHLAKLGPYVEKNKMTINNLSLIFTPAIFHDHNQPQAWVKDCVLEDLLTNVNTLFADKDLRSASAITGVIDYGFDDRTYEEVHSVITSVSTLGDDDEDGDEYYLPTPQIPPSYMALMIEETQSKLNRDIICNTNKSSINKDDNDSDSNINKDLSIPKQQESNNKKYKKYKPVPLDKGLTVNTNHPGIKSYSESTEERQNLINSVITISPSIQSATTASTDWLNHEPEGYSYSSTSTKLRRSATTGTTRTVKSSSFKNS